VIITILRAHRAAAILAALTLTTAVAVGCGGSAPPPPAAKSSPGATTSAPTATYDQQNGKLQELDFDRNGDGKVDTRAYMDGVLIKSIEIDRNGTGKPDRWEYYEPVANGQVPAGSPDGHSIITRAEEANGKNGKIDKWETYRDGLVAIVDLDLNHRGKPQRRFVYGPDGSLDHVEVDVKGDGNFKPTSLTPKGAEEAQPGHAPVRAGKGGRKS
jgi:hypothetical protein